MNMKKNNFFIACIVMSLLGMQSCMDFDVPGDELTGNTEEGSDEVYHGAADILDYHKEISQEGLDLALTNLAKEAPLGYILSATYSMRGGKEATRPGAHAYQYQFNMSVDNYAGYMVVPHTDFPFAMITLNSTYAFEQSVNAGPNGNYTLTKNYLSPILNHPDIDSIPEMKAVALLLFDYASQEEVDLYGSFPYTQFKANQQEHPYTYDSCEDIYKGIVDNLDSINACLKNYPNRPEWYKTKVNKLLKDVDEITDTKDFETWRKMGNSLKLRMAMHVVKRDKDLAKKWAEEAVMEGVANSLEDEVSFSTDKSGTNHPLAEISRSWGDSRLNASFEIILFSLKHPYCNFLFDKNSVKLGDLEANTRVIGLRAGKKMGEGQSAASNKDCGYSSIYQYFTEAPLYFIKLSEVDFLRAEGLVRGWNVGDEGCDAQFYYNRGIDNATCEWRMTAFEYDAGLADYKQVEEAVPYQYIDPIDASNNYQSPITIGVKWNAGDSDETKLEKIITQKYIALFPYSFEAWTEMRRTGYPKTLPVLNWEDADANLQEGDLLRRMRFPGTDTQAVAADVAATGLKALGGADLQSTRIWWDVEGTPNF